MSALVRGFAYFQLLHGVFPERLSRLEDTSWCPVLLTPPSPRFGVSRPPCSPQPGSAGFRCLWEGTTKPPRKWVEPRCGLPRLQAAQGTATSLPPAARLGRGRSPCSLGGCTRAWAAGPLARGWTGCGDVAPLPRYRKPRAGGAGREARGTAGGGCPFSVASPSACPRPHVGIQMEPPRAIGRRGVPRLGLFEFPLSTFSSHSVRLPR